MTDASTGTRTKPVQRLFFALWPDESVRSALVELQRERVEDGCFTRAGNVHMTLAFLCNVTAEAEARLCEEASEIDFAPFEVTLDVLDYFAQPQIVWAGCSEVPAALDELQDSVCDIVRRCLPGWDSREFTPHVSLSRKASYHAPALFEPILWKVGNFCLVHSQQGAAGSHYEIVSTFPALAHSG